MVATCHKNYNTISKIFFEMILVEMFSKIFFQNHIYMDVFENLTFRK